VRPASKSIPWMAPAGATILLVGLAAGGWLLFRSRKAHALTDKDTIVLADFTNTTGDAIFDETLKTGLNVSLRQSPFLSVLSYSGVVKTLQQMTRPASTKLTPEVARELCLRSGSQAYVAGSIASLGSEFVLGLKAVNCQSGDTLVEEQVTAPSKEKVLDALGEAASKLRGELGESLTTVQKFDVPLAEATTSSLEALKAYSLSQKELNEKSAAASLPYAQRAIELDPNFALGYLAVGLDYSSLNEAGRAREYFAKAFELRDHAHGREKLAITANYYKDVSGELYKAAQTYQEEIESYPREPGPYGFLGIVYSALGQYESAPELQSGPVHFSSCSSAPHSAQPSSPPCYRLPPLAARNPRSSTVTNPSGGRKQSSTKSIRAPSKTRMATASATCPASPRSSITCRSLA
jgi:hypothetical protein